MSLSKITDTKFYSHTNNMVVEVTKAGIRLHGNEVLEWNQLFEAVEIVERKEGRIKRRFVRED